ncbi:MAG: S8 family serine peptidase, partial [Aliifodinibius sp.]|nr:S8 family serine peptidase [Fodinibius sp.]NIY28874.1 S8 family serine peptidase [Fodinibius sp.]
MSLQPGGGYRTNIGTSFAAPAVSGTIALMLQANPLLTPAQVKAQIQQMAIELGPAGKDSLYGSGRIEAFQSVLMALAAANKTESAKATFSNNSR